MTLLVGVALAMLASSIWMAVGPQVPVFRSRRDLLAVLTWLATRALAVAVALQAHSPAARDLAAIAGQGLAGAAAGPMDAAQGAARLLPLLAADLFVWVTLVAEGDAGGEAAWSWAASPLVPWVAIAWGAPRVAVMALLALAYWFQRRGRDGTCGLMLGAAAAWGGPAAFAVALAIGVAPGRRLARLPGAAVAAAAVRFMQHDRVPAAFAVPWFPDAAPGAGVALSHLLAKYLALPQGPWSWLPCALALFAGVALLARREASGPAMVAYAFAVFALFAPSFPVRFALPFAPLLAIWAADDPDRRGWWFLESLALALAVVVDRLGSLATSSLSWRFIGTAWIAAAALLALWPLRTLAAFPRPPRAASRA